MPASGQLIRHARTLLLLSPRAVYRLLPPADSAAGHTSYFIYRVLLLLLLISQLVTVPPRDHDRRVMRHL